MEQPHRPAARTFEAMVDEYNASQDKVVVNFQPQGIAFEEVLRKYKLAAEDDSLPTLALLEDTTTQVMADSGTIIPGADCYDADPEGEAILDDFLPIAVASYSVDGKLQPVGFDVYTALVYYNRTHFTAAGLRPGRCRPPPWRRCALRREDQGQRGVTDTAGGRGRRILAGRVVAHRCRPGDRQRGQRARRPGRPRASSPTTRPPELYRLLARRWSADGLATAAPRDRGPDQPPLRDGHRRVPRS